MLDTILDYLSARAQEPSTWVSLGVFATGVGWNISPEHWQTIALVGMGAGGLLGSILRERKKATPIEIKNVVEAVVKPQSINPEKPTTKELTDAMKKPDTNGKPS